MNNDKLNYRFFKLPILTLQKDVYCSVKSRLSQRKRPSFGSGHFSLVLPASPSFPFPNPAPHASRSSQSSQRSHYSPTSQGKKKTCAPEDSSSGGTA